MPSPTMLLRGLAAIAFAAAPVAALDASPTSNITSGDAAAEGPGVGVNNTGGNVQIDNGTFTDNTPFIVPSTPQLAPKALVAAPVKPVNPAADAIAKANQLVADAKARADALIAAARANAEAAVQMAQNDAAAAQASAQAQSDAARSRSAAAAAAAQAGH